MSFGNKKEKTEKGKTVGQIRASQLITTFGSGAIADMPDYSVIMAGTDYWKEDSPVINEPNLERLLHVSSFRKPYVTEDSEWGAPDIPAFRFPAYHFCPTCGYLKTFYSLKNGDERKCSVCNSYLVPSRFVAACVNGHLEDFPYDWWAHYGKKCENADEEERDPSLTISFSDKSSGLESIIIRCNRCGKERSMAGCMSKEALRGYTCRGNRPWLGVKYKDHRDPVACQALMRGLQRGASNVYFAQTISALTIPPWSSRIHDAIQKEWSKYQLLRNANVPEDTIIPAVYGEVLSSGLCTQEQLIVELHRRLNLSSNMDYSVQMMFEDEYKMFIAPDQNDERFHTQHSPVPSLLSNYVSDVVLVRKLREVMALKGFRRIHPGTPAKDDEKYQGWHQALDYVPLSEHHLDWLPATEMKGEGIFLTFRQDMLDQWAEEHKKDYVVMRDRLEHSTMVTCDNFSPQYVFLHTISHLLIRQLSVECGYSGSSIKERIYSTYDGSDTQMAGILLYTSSSDSDGSLGGIVRMGLPDMLENLFRNLLQEASWCSSDPICIESDAQGMDSLNYAACHACTLLPETCCERRNCLLDRKSVVGSFDNREWGFLGALLDE